MKYIAMIAAGLALLLTAPAFAEDQPGGPGGMMDPAAKEARFNEKKQQVLKGMNQFMTEMQKRQACIEAATTPEAMHACFPQRGMGEGKGGRSFGKQ